MRRPNLLIVGVPRAGTTSMHSYLGQHPEIFMSPIKEPFYFCPDLNIRWQYRELDHYLSLFKSSGNAKHIGESTAIYMYSQVAAKQIKEFCPNAKIIVMLRHPVDMIYSWHGTLLTMAFEDILDFEQALDAQEERRKGNRIPEYCEEPKLLLYFEVAQYSSQLKRYFDIFGRENVHVIFFEDFCKNTALSYRRALEFLEVDPNFQPDLAVHNSTQSHTIPNLALRSFLFKRPALKATFRKFLPGTWVDWARNRLGKLTQPQRPKNMDSALRARLTKEFKPEIEKLSRLLDRDLSHWSS